MLLLLERLDVGRVVLLVDASFTSIAVNVSELVYSYRVFLVEWSAVEGLDGCGGFAGCCELDKSITDVASALHNPGEARCRNSPFCHALVVCRHKDCILTDLAHRGEFSQEELDELRLAVFGHDG